MSNGNLHLIGYATQMSCDYIILCKENIKNPILQWMSQGRITQNNI